MLPTNPNIYRFKSRKSYERKIKNKVHRHKHLILYISSRPDVILYKLYKFKIVTKVKIPLKILRNLKIMTKVLIQHGGREHDDDDDPCKRIIYYCGKQGTGAARTERERGG